MFLITSRSYSTKISVTYENESLDISTIYHFFFIVTSVVNQAGETALDTAKRVKAVQCEELVRTGGGCKAGKGGVFIYSKV